jgi:antitoxin YefM
MESITYTTARANLAKTMDRVCDDHEPVIITRSGETSVVMLSLEDFNSLEETAYLLRSPKNAKRLLEAIIELGTLSRDTGPAASTPSTGSSTGSRTTIC